MRTNYLLEAIKKDGSFLGRYTEGMSLLFSSGVFEFLREYGKVKVASPGSPNYVAEQAALGNISIGYNQAIDDLIYFREMFLAESEAHDLPIMSFGGLDEVVRKGDLTKEEADAIRARKSGIST